MLLLPISRVYISDRIIYMSNHLRFNINVSNFLPPFQSYLFMFSFSLTLIISSDLKLMRWIIAAITTLSKTNRQVDAESSFLLLKTKPSKDQKDIKESKMEKMKKESDIFADDMIAWKPWHHIWPKEQIGRFPLAPAYNPGGKYCVKIFWMVCI